MITKWRCFCCGKTIYSNTWNIPECDYCDDRMHLVKAYNAEELWFFCPICGNQTSAKIGDINKNGIPMCYGVRMELVTDYYPKQSSVKDHCKDWYS